MPHDHADHADHYHDHDHHGHANDQGIKGAVRYLRWLPQMWRSAINDAVIDAVDPQPGERVVDVGAGMGAGSIRVAAAGAHAIAVEPTPFMRRVLTARRALSRHRSKLDVVDGTAERIPAADHSVDVVVAVNTMHHWVDVERGVAEIARVLRPNGRMLLVDEDFDDPTHPEHEQFGSDRDHEHHGFTLVDAGQMGELFRAAGLTEIEAETRRLADRPVISVRSAGVGQP